MEKEIKNAIVVDGEIYDLVTVEGICNLCDECALLEQCDQIDTESFLCTLLFPDFPPNHFFVKREDFGK